MSGVHFSSQSPSVAELNQPLAFAQQPSDPYHGDTLATYNQMASSSRSVWSCFTAPFRWIGRMLYSVGQCLLKPFSWCCGSDDMPPKMDWKVAHKHVSAMRHALDERDAEKKYTPYLRELKKCKAELNELQNHIGYLLAAQAGKATLADQQNWLAENKSAAHERDHLLKIDSPILRQALDNYLVIIERNLK